MCFLLSVNGSLRVDFFLGIILQDKLDALTAAHRRQLGVRYLVDKAPTAEQPAVPAGGGVGYISATECATYAVFFKKKSALFSLSCLSASKLYILI
jgi:hypothetical protein